MVPTLRVTDALTNDLSRLLPRLLENLSLGRGQIALQQLETAARHDPASIVSLIVQNRDEPVAGAVMVYSRDSASHLSGSTTATMVHAGQLMNVAAGDRPLVASVLRRHLETKLARDGVEFVQWATDAAESNVDSWCEALGFEPIADLEYLSGETGKTLPNEQTLSSNGPNGPGELELVAISQDEGPNSLDTFAELVDRTYSDTRDCPRLSQFRTARQTLEGYRQASAYAPELWFRLVKRSDESAMPPREAGCLILARHGDETEAAPIIELVYMGLIPECRGSGLGTTVLRAAMACAKAAGSERMILAVDRSNDVARSIYRNAGFRWVLNERVWAKAM